MVITLGILFALPLIINNSLNFNGGNHDEINLDNENLKISAVSGKIHIDNNWTATKSAGICTGNGIYSDPYIIEDLVIDGGDSGSCIWIENSDVFFKIENCTVYNSGFYPGAGITLLNVNNSRLIDNNCSSNCRGINLRYSNNNTISGNIVSNSESRGIRLDSSDNNTISGNTANNNYWDGMYLDSSNNNTISGNTANNNNLSGIDLYSSDNNTISGNTLIGNGECIVESEDCRGNTFSDNGSCTYGQGNGGIPGYNLFFLLGILSVVVIVLSKKVK